MRRTTESRRGLVATVLMGLCSAAATPPTHAAEDMFDGNWHFSATPYLWLPAIDGTVNYDLGRGGSMSAQVDPGSYLQSLDFAGMIIGEARKGEWSVFTDYIFMHFSSARSPVRYVTDPSAGVGVPLSLAGSADLTSNLWTLAGGYTAWRGEQAFVDVFARFRFLNFRSTIGWNFATPVGTLPPGGSASESFNKWDGIVGLKGQVRFGDGKWFMPYYADIGSGTDQWTWQALLGVGYQFGWGELTLVVPSLSYEFDDDKLDLRMTGPALVRRSRSRKGSCPRGSCCPPRGQRGRPRAAPVWSSDDDMRPRHNSHRVAIARILALLPAHPRGVARSKSRKTVCGWRVHRECSLPREIFEIAAPGGLCR